jgi:PQQ-dependent dehydrogenase (methanol/ethanol family)
MTRHSFFAFACFFASAAISQAQSVEAGRKPFETNCAPCHGGDARGGERAPSLIRRSPRSIEDIRRIVRNGIPEAGMPAFHLAEAEESMLLAYLHALTVPAAESGISGDAAAGAAYFWGNGNCGRCHKIHGSGGTLGPDLTTVARERTLGDLEHALRQPGDTPGYKPVVVHLRDGSTLRGFERNRTNYDLQLQDENGGFHFLSADQIVNVVEEKRQIMPPVRLPPDQFRNLIAYLVQPSVSPADWTAPPLVIKPGEWPTYNGQYSGNRYSALRQIDVSNVARLAPKWIFPIPTSRHLEVTPIVADGVMYVTTANQAWALDARAGRVLWHYQRRLTKGLVGDASGAINRGVALLGDRVFMVTDNAHLIALDRSTGGLIWDIEMADYRRHYGATGAPLVVHDLVISGVSGGDEGARGFVSAYRASTGERVWRFWSIPAPGEPLSETWQGRAIEHGCGTTWLTGTFDPKNDLLYWTTGNPCPDYNGDERKGDNLYSDSVLALKPETGELKWHYQFTPHDLHDWDAEETPMLVDAEFHGRPRSLLIHANRNGFFYVLDRLNGELLLAKPFVKKLTWSDGIDRDGRPRVLPGSVPTIGGVTVCPAVEGATNWMSSAWNPATGLFYLMALEKCNIYTKSSAWWERGKSFYGGSTRDIPGQPGQKALRAIDIQTGNIAWEYPQIGPANSWGGVLATAGGLVFFGDDSGAFAAVDAHTGKPLWHFQTNQLWKASPMTYALDGKQYIAVAAGSSIIAFGL